MNPFAVSITFINLEWDEEAQFDLISPADLSNRSWNHRQNRLPRTKCVEKPIDRQAFKGCEMTTPTDLPPLWWRRQVMRIEGVGLVYDALVLPPVSDVEVHTKCSMLCRRAACNVKVPLRGHT